MNMPAHRLVVALGLVATGVLAACGGGAAESTPATPPAATAVASSEPAPAPSAAPSASAEAAPAPPAAPAAPPLVVAAMKLVGPKKANAVEIKADGTVLVDGKPTWTIAGAELREPSGAALFTVAADSTVKGFVISEKETAKFNDKDELVSDDGSQIAVGDDGVVRLVDKGGAPSKVSGKFKLVGFTPTARRSATLVAFMAIFAMQFEQAKADLKAQLKSKGAKGPKH